MKMNYDLTKEQLMELIDDVEKFKEYVMNSIVTKKRYYYQYNFEITGKDESRREVFWELADDPITRQYSIYPFEKGKACVTWFPRLNRYGYTSPSDSRWEKEDFVKYIDDMLSK